MPASTSNEPAPGILNQFSLKGKVIVITGGGRGLGLTFGLAMAEAGASIACIDIHEQPHEDFAKLSTFGRKSGYYR
jgi:sorbose reductase